MICILFFKLKMNIFEIIMIVKMIDTFIIMQKKLIKVMMKIINLILSWEKMINKFIIIWILSLIKWI